LNKKAIINKYLKAKSGCIYWSFVDTEKVLDSVNREALWYKIGKEGLSEGKRKWNVRKVRIRQIKFM
jgi:hypothetical protein